MIEIHNITHKDEMDCGEYCITGIESKTTVALAYPSTEKAIDPVTYLVGARGAFASGAKF